MRGKDEKEKSGKRERRGDPCGRPGARRTDCHDQRSRWSRNDGLFARGTVERRDTWVPPYNSVFCRAGPACPAGDVGKPGRADVGIGPYEIGCRGGRLCPPRPDNAIPCRAGPVCPAVGTVGYRRRGEGTPPYGTVCRGGRLCPPDPDNATPCRAGPVCPAGGAAQGRWAG